MIHFSFIKDIQYECPRVSHDLQMNKYNDQAYAGEILLNNQINVSHLLK